MAEKYTITPQHPIPSGFGPQTTARDVIRGLNLTGKVSIVTGGYSGVGLETSRALTEAGAQVIVPARTSEKARSAIAGMPRAEIAELDLIDPISINSFAQQFLSSGRQLDILMNNAGIMAPPLVRDKRGYESQFATNHLGHFQLTIQLWPALKKSGNARVVSLSSTGIQFGGVDFDDPNFERREYNKWQAYGQSKSANSLFAVALDRRGFQDGVRCFAVHPGRIMTDLARYMSEQEMKSAGGGLITTEQGAATSVWCATSTQLNDKGGVFCMDVDIAPLVSTAATLKLGDMLTGVLPWAIDPDLAEKLWHMSEEMTDTKFAG
ncbi:SDR family NAD(P)-dependent oxidoreductase [bacterium]|nr:SDR family NAD(P)-dependent oxidoreductase [bacterium]